jgi:hypothetical protein
VYVFRSRPVASSFVIWRDGTPGVARVIGSSPTLKLPTWPVEPK